MDTPVLPSHATADGSSSQRSSIYRDLHDNQLVPDTIRARNSAKKILSILFKSFRPGSVLDVGCGIGAWLLEVSALGATDTWGIEGQWLKTSQLVIPPERVAIMDLEQPFDLGRQFDLVISLEVAEHLPEERAAGFIEDLSRHGDAILFSAAVPFQGGHHHLNEQWPAYWADLFNRLGYSCLDCIRERIWEDREIFWHLRQNILLFVSEKIVRSSPFNHIGKYSTGITPLPLVHPEPYRELFRVLGQLQEIHTRYDQLVKYLLVGGTFAVSVKNGDLNISRKG